MLWSTVFLYVVGLALDGVNLHYALIWRKNGKGPSSVLLVPWLFYCLATGQLAVALVWKMAICLAFLMLHVFVVGYLKWRYGAWGKQG
ncbi:MAG: hypothetical protein JSS65_13965 [Armatimonadetes bacterium]|nr:hypothetical protein [Armatimonadota bacterium]